jgi:hypothetical protein
MTSVNFNRHSFQSIEVFEWKDIRKSFKKLNEKLAKIIDEINPGKAFPFVKVRYKFGDRILKQGRFLLMESIKNKTVGLSDQEAKKIGAYLNYSPIPLGIYLDNQCEVFSEIEDRVVPLFVLEPGNTIGLFETLNYICGKKSNPLWDVTAGARSLFMLPQINNNIGHKRLKKAFSLTEPVPKTLVNQWRVFREISQRASEDWRCHLLFFTEPWLKKLRDTSSGWTKFREYLFKKTWVEMGPIMEKTFSFVWQQFTSALIKRRFKPRTYITDTIRHLIETAYGFIPGFVPAVPGDNRLGPTDFIKQAYVEVYGLKEYLPILMKPVMVSKAYPLVYYSVGYPTLFEGHPEISNPRNTITDLREIKLLLDNMYKYCRAGLVEFKKFDKFIDTIQFDYFHKAFDVYEEIKPASQIVIQDKNFLDSNDAQSNKTFCATSPFLNGCIQISRNKDSMEKEDAKVKNHWIKNRNILENKELGKQGWQKCCDYGRWNKSE